MTAPEKPPANDASFLIVWAYLMVVAIALAPVVASMLGGQ